MDSEKVVAVIVLFVVVVAVMSVVVAYPVMLLWNWLMPELFGLATIDFWQALGISVLCQLLFKSTSSSSRS